MKTIPEIIEWSLRALSQKETELREAERTACMIRKMLELRYSVSAAILFVASEAFRLDLWHTAEGDFESFELWVEFVFDGTQVKRGTTLWTVALSFSTGLAPYLRQHQLEDEHGEITPERVLEEAGYSLLQDVNTAWWSQFKNFPLERETADLMESVVMQIMKPGTTRESIDEWLVAEGHRQREEGRELPYAEQPCSEGIAFVVMCPTSDDVEFLRKKLQKHLAMFPGRLQEVCDELVFVGEWGIEMIEQGEQ